MGLLDYFADEYSQAKNSFGLLGEVLKGAKRNPDNLKTVESIKGLLGATPGIGDAIAAKDAFDYAKQGQYGMSALAGVGALPFIPTMAGTINKGVKVIDLPINPSAYTSESMGSAGQKILLNGDHVGTTNGKLKNAVADFLDEVRNNLDISVTRSKAASKAADTRDKNRISDELTKRAYDQNKELIENIHKTENLSFNPIDNTAFSRGYPVYQSPSYGRKKGSSYKIIDINGEPAYARQADHWGDFSTNDFVNGEPISSSYKWLLPGAENATWGNNKRYTGYILLKDLIDK